MQPVDSEARYQELAEKWLNDTITIAEREEFDRWYNDDQGADIHLPENFVSEYEHKNRIYSAIDEQITNTRKLGFGFSRRWSAAAVAIVIVSLSLYWYQTKRIVPKDQQSTFIAKKPVTINTASEKKPPEDTNEIIAGSNKAILTLADGTKIVLDNAHTGILANRGGNSIRKTAEGELVFTFSEESATASDGSVENVKFNVIETPKGGKFQIKLSDGSKVWLNAASSLRFPAKFSDNKRQVQLTGEAYFEVAHDTARVFEVATRNQTVRVLGTSFNINAYSDEPSINTTLLKGSVRISDLRTNRFKMLKPGEQSKLSEDIEIVHLEHAEEAVAWKEGYFQFNHADIQTVMRQIERWYDVSVRYEGAIPTQKFGGEIERSLNLSQVIKILEKMNLHLRLEGRELIVMS